MPKYYEYLKNGVVYGPVTAKEIRRLAAAGQIDPDDLIRKVSAEGRGQWVWAGAIRGLQFAQPSPSPGVAKPPPADPPAPVPCLPVNGNTAPAPVLGVSYDPPAAPNAFSELMNDASQPTRWFRPKVKLAFREYVLAVFWGILGFLWACPVGCSSIYLVRSSNQSNNISGEHSAVQLTLSMFAKLAELLAVIVLFVSLICLLVLFGLISNPSFYLRLCMGILLFWPFLILFWRLFS